MGCPHCIWRIETTCHPTADCVGFLGEVRLDRVGQTTKSPEDWAEELALDVMGIWESLWTLKKGSNVMRDT